MTVVGETHHGHPPHYAVVQRAPRGTLDLAIRGRGYRIGPTTETGSRPVWAAASSSARISPSLALLNARFATAACACQTVFLSPL